jgi:hypothetical protein
MSSPTTNPTPEEVLAEFRDLGTGPIPPWEVTKVHIRVLTARGVYLAARAFTIQEQDEFDAIEQELANRVIGRAPYLK